MFVTIHDIFKYKEHYEHFKLTTPYKFTINDDDIIIWYTKSYCYNLTLGISCNEIFYYRLMDHIDDLTLVDDFNINLSVKDKYVNFCLNITYFYGKLRLYLITTKNSNFKSMTQFLFRLPAKVNILSIDSKIYYLHIEDFNNLPTTLESLKLRNHSDTELTKFIEKIPFGCKIELSDDF